MRTKVRLGRIQHTGWVNLHMGFNNARSLKLSFVSDPQPNLRYNAAKNKTRLAARKNVV